MARLTQRCYLGLDKSLRKRNRAVFDDAINPKDLITTIKIVMGKVILDPHYHFNRAQWTTFIEERAEESRVTFFFVGYAHTMEMMYFLNWLGSRKKVRVILLLAEETPDTSIIDKFNDSVKVVDYWKYIEGHIDDGKLKSDLGKATAR